MFLTYSIVFLFQSRFFYYLATKRNKIIKVEVEQDQEKVTLSTISTYGLSPCHLLLLDGYYNDKPFAYLNHHAFWMEAEEKRLMIVSLPFYKILFVF